MKIILLCWGIGAIIGVLWGLCRRQENGTGEETEGAPLVPMSASLSDTFAAMEAQPNLLSEVLGNALREYRRMGGSGLPLVQLDCCVRAALCGNLETSVAVYVLEKTGMHSYAEKIKGMGL